MVPMEPLRELRRLAERHVAATPFAMLEHRSLGLKLAVARCGQPAPIVQVYARSFGVVVHGTKRVQLGAERFVCTAGTFIVSAVELPVEVQVARATPAEPFIGLSIALEPRQIAALLLDAAATERAPVQVAGLGGGNAPAELLDTVVRFVRLLDQPRDVPMMAPLVERELLWRLLCSEQGYRLRQIGLADSRLSQIGRAMQWLRDHYSEHARMADLARLAGMSTTSFHRHFRAIALMSPLQYQKKIRLQAARAALLAGAQDVARVGHAVGYDSPSQFSREYKRAYGLPPGQDARATRTEIERETAAD